MEALMLLPLGNQVSYLVCPIFSKPITWETKTLVARLNKDK